MTQDKTQADEAALVEQFKRGKMAAYEYLFDQYCSKVYRYIHRLVGDPVVAEDLTQEAFLRAFTWVRKLQGEVNFSAWIYRVATNLCHDHFRQRTRNENAVVDYARRRTLSRNRLSPEQRLLEREQATRMINTLSRLLVNYRTVLLLKYVEGMSYREIGAILSLSEAAVTSLLYRARTELRRRYSLKGMRGHPHAMS